MSGITAAQATAKLAEYLAAETKVLAGQAYTIGGRSMTRANLKEIREGIDYWDNKCVELGVGRSGITLQGANPTYDR